MHIYYEIFQKTFYFPFHSVTSFREFPLTWGRENSILEKQFDLSNCRQQGEWIRFELEKSRVWSGRTSHPYCRQLPYSSKVCETNTGLYFLHNYKCSQNSFFFGFSVWFSWFRKSRWFKKYCEFFIGSLPYLCYNKTTIIEGRHYD